MEKLYDRIDWNNNTSPALNETNLNLMSKAVDDIDDRVVAIAGTVMETVPQIQEDLEEAQDLLEDAEAISTHPPIIGQNGNWWTWDTTIEDYADSGIDAGVSLTIGTTSTLTPGSDATVTNSGTATDPILNFGIPAGVAGQNGQDGADGADGVSPTVTIGTITGGHSVTITDADHPTGQTFNVMDGEDGVGIPTGGTTGQVLKKKSGTNYDTEWGDDSAGHTILNGSGSAMNQRGKLQFDGLNVSDDSGNDKTVVTAPNPDYVDAQYSSSKTYSKGMTCISGNKRYRYINSTVSSRHQPPNTTYWEVLSVADQLSEREVEILKFTGTTSLSSGYQRLATKTIGETWTQLRNKYRYILIMALRYSAAQTSAEYGQFYPHSSALFPTDKRTNNNGANYVSFSHLADYANLKGGVIQLGWSSNDNVGVDYVIMDSSSTTYQVGYAIYGIK